MPDEASVEVSTATGLPIEHPAEASRAQLKLRLVKFWNSFEFGRDPGVDEAAASLPYREAMSSYVPLNSRILDIACGTCANSRWLVPRGQYFGVDISQGLLRLVRTKELQL